MMRHIKQAIPICFGVSIAGTLVNYFSFPSLWETGNYILNLLVIFVTSTAFVSICSWIWSQVTHK